ncbi:MAG TPA: LysR family transcriptional regulator, partial [Phenylobacterium sp.]
MAAAPRRPLPPLSALQAFERAGDRLSFRLAANDLALSPSAISHQIRGLEDLLGIQLFSRARGAIALTDAGRDYFHAVGRSLNELRDATRSLLEHRNDFATDLRIGVTPFFSSAVMLPSLLDLKADGRPWTLHLETADRDVDFEKSGLDVAIRLGPGPVLG